jgi:hypothetical protein
LNKKFKNKLIGIAIFAGGLFAINLWRGPPDFILRDQSLTKMVHGSLTRFHQTCQHLWDNQGPQENCTKESLPEVLRNSFDLPGIFISGEGNEENWQATARHELLLEQVFIIDTSGSINHLN